MNKNTAVQTTSADQFLAAIFGVMSNLAAAGEIAAREIAANPNWIDEVCDKCPDMTPSFIRKMEAIGNKKLLPQLAISEAPGVRRLTHLPLALQERYNSEPVPLHIQSDKAVLGWETLKVDVRNLTPDQAKQVFSDDGVRTEEEQRTWIEDAAAARRAPKLQDAPYRIVGKKVVFMTQCTLSVADLASIISKVEAKQ